MYPSSTHISIIFSRGWIVTFASAALGLALGILYVWSVIKSGIPDAWGWSHADKALPYSTMAIVFSFVMVPAGRLQDRFGPRPIILGGGLLAGLGCIIAGVSNGSLMGYVAGFGVMAGMGVGSAYSALTPATIKWFPPEKTGLTAGIVVAGSGMAPLPLAPLTAWLLKAFSVTTPEGVVHAGIGPAMIALGVLLWIATLGLVWFIYNPPMGFKPPSNPGKQGPGLGDHEFTWQQMLGTAQFWLMFVMYFSGASAGLVFIGTAAQLGREVLGEMAFFAVVVIAAGNTLGRILAGVVSDRVGRQPALFAEFTCQAAVVGALYLLMKTGGPSWMAVLAVMFMIGLNYGANLTIFPAACKDYFGIRNFGLNYGCLFTAFGAAGLIMPWLNGLIRDLTGKTDLSYFLIMGLLVLSAALALISRNLGAPSLKNSPMKKKENPQNARSFALDSGD
ncbi:MAG: OFA family MFS transporter [Desulfobacter sp.]|nr:MAG: OFA family MFS transporter [Desulfobacter sp.]